MFKPKTTYKIGVIMSNDKFEELRESVKDDLEGMSMNDFSNLVEKYDLGIETIDSIFYQVVEKIVEEKSN